MVQDWEPMCQTKRCKGFLITVYLLSGVDIHTLLRDEVMSIF